MVSIRPIELRDAPAVFAAVDQSRAALARWMDWYHPEYGVDDAVAWVRRSVEETSAGTGYHFVICNDGGDVVGVLSVEDVATNEARAMLGYWVASPATGRGVATAAVGQALAWSLAHTKIMVVWALIASDNVASRRAVEANGLRLRPVDSSETAAARQLMYEFHRPVEPGARDAR